METIDLTTAYLCGFHKRDDEVRLLRQLPPDVELEVIKRLQKGGEAIAAASAPAVLRVLRLLLNGEK